MNYTPFVCTDTPLLSPFHSLSNAAHKHTYIASDNSTYGKYLVIVIAAVTLLNGKHSCRTELLEIEKKKRKITTQYFPASRMASKKKKLLAIIFISQYKFFMCVYLLSFRSEWQKKNIITFVDIVVDRFLCDIVKTLFKTIPCSLLLLHVCATIVCFASAS